MTVVGVAMNLILAGLLLAAMVVGIRLNRRLGALRDSHEGFEIAVRDLNLAAQRAEQGLADLRAATDEATDTLSDRIEKGRVLASRLERLVSSAPELPKAVPSDRVYSARNMPSAMPVRESAAEERLSTLLALARARLEAEGAPGTQVQVDEDRARPRPSAGRTLALSDDDLFEDTPLTLDRVAGGRR